MMIQDASKLLASNPELASKMQEDPVGTLQTMAAAAPLQSDVWIYRIVVTFLGLVAVAGVAGGLALSIYDKSVPDGVIALSATALGAIGALLAQPPARS